MKLLSLFAAALLLVSGCISGNKGFTSDFVSPEIPETPVKGKPLFTMISGSLKASSVEFMTNARPLILTPGKNAQLNFREAPAGKTLYLLHGSESKAEGELLLSYADGSSEKRPVKPGTGMAEISRLTGAGNAVCGFYQEDGTAHRALFVSRFALKKPLKAITLRHTGKRGKWIVAGAAVGPGIALKKLQPEGTPGGLYRVPRKLSDKELAVFSKNRAPKNIILIIGDGMGEEALKAALLYSGSGTLPSWQLPVRGRAATFSANSKVTDSAAGGTALATGVKTKNSSLGVDPAGRRLLNIAEAAKLSGRAAGVITNDKITGATPSAFSAHQPKRNMTKEIIQDQVNGSLDILIGSGKAKDYNAATGHLKGISKPWKVVSSPREFFRAKVPVMGLMYSDRVTALGDLAAAAFEKLAAASPKGFFCMIESTWCDWGGHGNNVENSVKGALAVEWVLLRAVEFARNHPETLIVITADHETGRLDVTEKSRRPLMKYGTTSHTDRRVPVRAIGPGCELFRGEIDNTAIPRAFARLWLLNLNHKEK